MKKLVALFVGLIILGISATTVSAAEYEVKKGDNLWNIAKENNTTVNRLMEINGLDSSLIYPEQVLQLHEEDLEFYVVEKGDTLTEISEEQGEEVTITDLMGWNDLRSDLIYVGQELIVDGLEPVEELDVLHVSNKDKSVVSNKEKTVSIASAKVESTEEESAPKPKEKEEPQKEEKLEPKAETKSKSQPEGRTLSVEATAYTAYCSGCSGITATGVDLKANPSAKVIAVDPNVIPLGTKVHVEGYGNAIAADTGGAIKGNKIDIHVPTKNEAYQWGRRVVELTILE